MADPGELSGLVQSTAEGREEDPEPKVPWHFWLLIIATAVYLGWRAIQGVEWLIRQIAG